MKKLLILTLVVVLSSCATNTSFNTFYKNNSQHSDFAMGLNSSLIGSFLSNDDEDVKDLLKKAKHVRIMVFSDNYDQMNTKFNKFIKHSRFDKLVKIKNDDNNIRIFSLEEKDKIKEIVVQISTGDELILLGLKTNLTQEDLADLIEKNEITFN